LAVQAIRLFALNTSTYTTIVTPLDCNFYLIVGSDDGSAMRRSSDGTDANSYLIPAGGWYAFLAPTGGIAQNPLPTKAKDVITRIRWLAGDTVTYIKASAGTPKVIVEFSI
jgi:hypothetical protein